MPIYLVRPGLWRTLWLLTELSLPGVPLPVVWAVPSSYSLHCKAGATIVAQSKQKTDPESVKYDCKPRPNQVSHFKRPGRYEINAGCDCRRFFGQSSRVAKSSSNAGGDRTPHYFHPADRGTSRHYPGTLRPALRRLLPLGIKRVNGIKITIRSRKPPPKKLQCTHGSGGSDHPGGAFRSVSARPSR